MTDYTTVERIYNVLPKIEEVTEITSAQLEQQIVDAESGINARLSKTYAVPVSDAPLLVQIATDLSIYRVLSQRILTGETLKESPWPDRFKEANDLLDKIVSGDIDLVTSSGTVITPTNDVAPWSSKEDFIPTFDEDSVFNHETDDDKIDDIEAERGL